MIRKIKNGFRVDNVTFTKSHKDYRDLLRQWYERRRFNANKALLKFRGKPEHLNPYMSKEERNKLKPVKPVKVKREKVVKLSRGGLERNDPIPIQTRVTADGIKVYCPEQRMWMVFRTEKSMDRFFRRLQTRDADLYRGSVSQAMMAQAQIRKFES